VASTGVRRRNGSSAKALLLTLLGEFVLPHGGGVWTQTLVEMLASLGVEEKNARQALARSAEDGLIASAREGRRVRWHLTQAGAELLTTGTRRIYGFLASEADWDGHWLVVLCPVPEEQRSKRHQLRSRLAFAGFGFLDSGVAITPHLEREAIANEVLKDLDLAGRAVVLRAEPGELTPTDDLLHQAWDLEALADRYRAFVRTFTARRPVTDIDHVRALSSLVDEWRRFPFVDPEIPDTLLPTHWPGRRAKALFDDRHTRWSPAANGWFVDVESV
jgi:phenylacetic acid degradation operon negative regulatory protein